MRLPIPVPASSGLQEGVDVGTVVAAVAAQRADRGFERSDPRPQADRGHAYAENLRHLTRRQQVAGHRSDADLEPDGPRRTPGARLAVAPLQRETHDDRPGRPDRRAEQRERDLPELQRTPCGRGRAPIRARCAIGAS